LNTLLSTDPVILQDDSEVFAAPRRRNC
jgi:hypothetical protein